MLLATSQARVRAGTEEVRVTVKGEHLHDINRVVTGSTGAPEAGHMTGGVASPGAGLVIDSLGVGHMTGHVTKRGVAGLGASHVRREGLAGLEADLVIGSRGNLGVDLVKGEGVVGLGAILMTACMGDLGANHTAGGVGVQGQSPETGVEDSQGAGPELVIRLRVKDHTLVAYQVVHTETELKITGSCMLQWLPLTVFV